MSIQLISQGFAKTSWYMMAFSWFILHVQTPPTNPHFYYCWCIITLEWYTYKWMSGEYDSSDLELYGALANHIPRWRHKFLAFWQLSFLIYVCPITAVLRHVHVCHMTLLSGHQDGHFFVCHLLCYGFCYLRTIVIQSNNSRNGQFMFRVFITLSCMVKYPHWATYSLWLKSRLCVLYIH